MPYFLIVLLIICAGVSTVEVILNMRGEDLSEATSSAWTFIYVILVALWVQRDSLNEKFERPFDFGLFLYLFLPVLLPYYLVRTRGVEGIFTFLGFVLVYFLPFILGLVTYAYFT